MSKSVSFEEFARLYCSSQLSDPEELLAVLREKSEIYQPDGWVLLRCIVLDSSRLGERVILPYGGAATLKSVPNGPISPRGLTSDTSEVEAVLDIKEVLV